ncbi:hypothetical protein LIER_34058 [Lithospermum erythrorhizon]|uniref:Uncharacterized protein n=1 Tax=Lithospermum erythrorhizon TaxID=34254 RepID=A0AAV3S1P9_LITER
MESINVKVLDQGIETSDEDIDDGTNVNDICPHDTSRIADGQHVDVKCDDSRIIQPLSHIQNNHPVDNIIGQIDQGVTKGGRNLLTIDGCVEEEPVFNPTPIRSVPPDGITHDVTQEEAPKIHNFYLPWVDYTKVRELDNPRSSRVNQDDDVGGEEFDEEIHTEKDVTEAIGVVDVSEPSGLPIVDDTTGKTVEPFLLSEKFDDVSSDNDPKEDNVDLSHADNIVTEGVEIPSTEGLGVSVDPSVNDTLDGIPTWRDVLRPTVGHSVKDIIVEDMDADISSATGTEPVTVEATSKGVIPSVIDTGEETADQTAKESVTIVSQGAADTLNEDIEEVNPEVVAEKAIDADVHEEADDHVLEEEVALVIQQTVSDEWFSKHEKQDGNVQEEAQESDEGDVVAVIRKRKKATGKLKLNENRTKVRNKRVSKNVVVVSTTNVSLNSEKEEAKCRFVGNNKVVAEKMLSEVTKKNANIIGILEGAGG